MRKCSVDIVTGFLSSGKTSFINIFLNKTLKREETLVVQCESGSEKLSENLSKKLNVNIKNFSSNKELTEERLIRLIKFYKPERMILECNGVEDLTYLIEIFNRQKVRSYFKLTGVITLVDALTFNMFLKNLGHIILPYIEKSDLVILNRCNTISTMQVDKDIDIIKNLNDHAHILAAFDKNDLEVQINKAKIISA